MDAQRKKRDRRQPAKRKVSTSVIFSQAALAIAPINVRGDGIWRPGEEDDIDPSAIAREIRQRLPEAMRDQFGFVAVSLGEHNSLVEMEPYVVPYRGGQLALTLPAESSSFMLGNDVADYILFVQDAMITPAEKAVAEGVSTNYMLSFKFAMWDNVLGEPHSYGVVYTPVSANGNAEIWNNTAKHIAQTMHAKLAIAEEEPLPKSLNFKFSVQPRFHVVSTTEPPDFVPDEFSNTVEEPSIAHHFDDNFAIAPAVEYIVHNFNHGFGIGFEYARESIAQGSEPLIFLVEGVTPELYLTVQSYSLTLAYYSFTKSSDNVAFYARGKLSLVDYAMNETIAGETLELDFEETFGLGLGLGMRIAPPQWKFGLQFEAGYEYSSVTLNAVRAGGEESRVGVEFFDPRWYFGIGAFYTLTF